jgi:hypothetical protein
MMNIRELIDEIVDEVSYRTENGLVDFRNGEHVYILSEVLTEMGLGGVKDELIQALMESDEEKKFKNPILNKVVKYKSEEGEEREGIVGNLLRLDPKQPGRVAAEKLVPAKGTPERKALEDELGSEGQPGRDIEGEREKGGEEGGEMEEPELGTALNPDTKGGAAYIDNLPDGDPAKKLANEVPPKIIAGKNKALKKVDTLNSEEFNKELTPADSDFEDRNKEYQNPTPPPPLKLEGLVSNPKFPKKYIQVLERMLNSRATNETAKWKHFSDLPGGAGKISAQAGELMTMMSTTMGDGEWESVKKTILEHERELIEKNPDIFKKKDSSGKLVDNPASRIIDKSWVIAADNNRKIIRKRLEKKYGDISEIIASWDTEGEVSALGLDDYSKNKGFSTDVYFKIKTKSGEYELDEVSLKKSKNVNFMNSGAGKFSEWDDDLPDNINQEVYSKNERKRNLGFVKKNKDEVEEFINSDKGKSIRDEMKRKGIKWEAVLGGKSRPAQKILWLCCVEMGKDGNAEASSVVEETYAAHKEFQKNAISAITSNEKLREGMLTAIRSEFPLKSVSDGEETMAIGDMSLDKDTMVEMFGTSDYDEIKEKLVAEPGPPPFLGYKLDVSGKVIPIAKIDIREDGIGYGGQIRFDMVLDPRFAETLKSATEKVYG